MRQKRRAQGLTQLQLAEDAFGSGAKTRRISELEGGSVANPHPRTIDPIIHALGIPEAQIEECAKEAGTRPDPDLDRAYREARNLIEALARQFENDDPETSLAELDRFLREKAAEWARLKTRIANLDLAEAQLADLKREAAAALDDARFEEVDDLLAQAEEVIQRTHTLEAIRAQADVRISRGDAALLRGAPDAALAMYSSAAEFYRPFDVRAMADTADALAFRVYDLSRRSLRPAFFVAAALLETRLGIPIVFQDPVQRAECHYQLALCYRNEFERPNRPDRERSLSAAIEHAKVALDTVEVREDGEKLISCAVAFANCLRDRGKLGGGATELRVAAALLDDAKAKFGDDPRCGRLMPHLENSRGATFLALMRASKGKPAAKARERAIDAFEQALKASELNCDLDVWGAARFNIGAILALMANAPGIPAERRYFLRLRATTDLIAATESFSAVASPFLLGEAQGALGRVLLEQANDEPEDMLAEALLVRAVQTIEIAASMVSRDHAASRWAKLAALLGTVFERHSLRSEPTVALRDLEQAKSHYEEAAMAFEAAGETHGSATCRRAATQALRSWKELKSKVDRTRAGD